MTEDEVLNKVLKITHRQKTSHVYKSPRIGLFVRPSVRLSPKSTASYMDASYMDAFAWVTQPECHRHKGRSQAGPKDPKLT